MLLLELLTALLEYLDVLTDLYNLQLIKLHYCLKMPAYLLILTHTNYSRNYPGIIASSLRSLSKIVILNVNNQMATWNLIQMLHVMPVIGCHSFMHCMHPSYSSCMSCIAMSQRVLLWML